MYRRSLGTNIALLAYVPLLQLCVRLAGPISAHSPGVSASRGRGQHLMAAADGRIRLLPALGEVSAC